MDMGLPRNVLMIKDLTFILPDDFNGSLEDAIIKFIEYREKHMNRATFIDVENSQSTMDLLVKYGIDHRVCGEYGLFVLDEGTYKIVQGSCPDDDDDI